MSLVLALKGRDGIVVASDSRATIGDPRGLVTANDTVQKIFKLTDKVVLGIAGEANLGVSIINTVAQKLKEQKSEGLKNVVELVRRVSLELLGSWLGQREVITPQAVISRWPSILYLIAGYDSNNLPNMYILNSVHNFAPELSTLNFAAIGVVPLAVYLLNRLHDPSASVETLKLLATYCIIETASQDGKVGGPIQMMVVTPKETIKVEEKEIEALVQKAEKHNNMLREAFYMNDKEV